MKFSIVIPTQDRSNLLAVIVKYAMQNDYTNFEVIVSDNSTTEKHRQLNATAVQSYIGKQNFQIIYPPQVLSPPEHFEFALHAATGDYVIYLTDKMVILPNTLSKTAAIIKATKADIVNWAYASYAIEDTKNPGGMGLLVEEVEFLCGKPEIYDPLQALRFKANSNVPRDRQTTRDYALGKIIFGCYSKDLITRIRAHSGILFGGTTHDYSAMIQALSMAKTCVMLNTYGVLFYSLPRDQSLGSLITTDAQKSLQYYRTFTDSDSLLSSLLVPGVYASPHNMVAHDYKKFLPIYNNEHFFDITNWLLSIKSDLEVRSKIWSTDLERTSQIELFMRCVEDLGQKSLLSQREKKAIRASAIKQKSALLMDPIKKIVSRIQARLARITKGNQSRRALPTHQAFSAKSLDEAVQHILSHSQ